MIGCGTTRWRRLQSWDTAACGQSVRCPGARADIPGADRLLEYELRIHHEVFDLLPLKAWCFYDRRLLSDDQVNLLAGAHLTRRGDPVGGPVLRVAPLLDHPGLLMAGSTGYDTRHVVAAAAAALRGMPTKRVELDLAGLRHVDAARWPPWPTRLSARPVRRCGSARHRRPCGACSTCSPSSALRWRSSTDDDELTRCGPPWPAGPLLPSCPVLQLRQGVRRRRRGLRPRRPGRRTPTCWWQFPARV
ncbi:hypothetical protein SGLAM104S_00251 [Streptomyces glaucescens]